MRDAAQRETKGEPLNRLTSECAGAVVDLGCHVQPYLPGPAADCRGLRGLVCRRRGWWSIGSRQAPSLDPAVTATCTGRGCAIESRAVFAAGCDWIRGLSLHRSDWHEEAQDQTTKCKAFCIKVPLSAVAAEANLATTREERLRRIAQVQRRNESRHPEHGGGWHPLGG